MNIRRLFAAAAVLAAGIAAPVAAAADSTPALKVTGAYAYIDTLPSKQKLVKVVFETASALPRRADGLIQAGISIEGINHSIGSAKRGSRCYTGGSEIKGGSIPALRDGDVVRKGAKIGRTFTAEFFLRDGTSVTKKLKLRAERRGDDSGKPLGC